MIRKFTGNVGCYKKEDYVEYAEYEIEGERSESTIFDILTENEEQNEGKELSKGYGI